MSNTPSNEFPQKISKYFFFDGQIYPRGGVIRHGKTTVLIGATTYIIGLRQNHDDLTITKIQKLNQIPVAPRNVNTVDQLLLHAYKAIFTPRYAEIIKGNKTLAVGIVYSKLIDEHRAVYWLYDAEENVKFAVEFNKAENITIKYTEIPENELNSIIMQIFNFDGVKEMLKFYLQHGLFVLDSYGE
jgi:hypothetical protein